MSSRIAAALTAAVLVGAIASGCTPQPTPEPTPTSTATFTSDEEAFAAAEATYRAYVDALNQVDLSDPETFEPVFGWTTGELNAADRKGLSNYHANEVVLRGESKVLLVAPGGRADYEIDIAVCLDVSAIELTDPAGRSLVDPDRVDVQTLAVRLEHSAASPTGLLLSDIGPREGDPTCG